MKLGHKGWILVAVPLVCELVILGSLYGLLRQVEYERAQEARAQAIAAHLNHLLRAVIYAGALTSGNALSRRTIRKLQGPDPLDLAPQEFAELKKLTADDPEQLKRVKEIEKLTYQGVDDLKEIRDLTEDGQSFQAIFDMRHFSSLATKIGAKIDIVIRDAELVEKDQTKHQERTRRAVQDVLLIGLFGNVILAIMLVVIFNRSTTQRLAVLLDNTMRLASGKPLLPPVAGSDEIAYLDKVFRDTANALAESETTKRELMAMITHDLRSPLAAVQAVLEMTAMGVYGEQSREAVQHLNLAETNVHRVLRLINDLLDIEKMRAGKLPMEIHPTSLIDVIKRSAEAVKSLADQKQLQIGTPVQDVLVEADGDRMVQVLINLLTNAVKYSDDGTKIKVAWEIVEDDQVELSVSDTGCGIAPEYHKAIFEKFEQAGQPATPIGKSSGTGLGLAICKAIVDQHGGIIGVRSELDKGSTFWLRLPKPKDETTASPVPSEPDSVEIEVHPAS